jgi:ABC-type sulfate transport system permease component
MKKFGGTLVFAGIVLIVGPFFGFTIRGTAQSMEYGPAALMGLGAIVIGFLILSSQKR